MHYKKEKIVGGRRNVRDSGPEDETGGGEQMKAGFSAASAAVAASHSPY